MEGRAAVPGGAALNSARCAAFAAKMMAGNDNCIDYFGAIGKDARGEELQKAVADAGVVANWHMSEKTTGVAGIVVDKDKERTIVADISAACDYQPSRYKKLFLILSQNLQVIRVLTFQLE